MCPALLVLRRVAWLIEGVYSRLPYCQLFYAKWQMPGMSYDGMEVAEGSEAGLAWEKMVHAEEGSQERVKLRADLLAYCRQDTLAMVKLLEVLYKHSSR